MPCTDAGRYAGGILPDATGCTGSSDGCLESGDPDLGAASDESSAVVDPPDTTLSLSSAGSVVGGVDRDRAWKDDRLGPRDNELRVVASDTESRVRSDSWEVRGRTSTAVAYALLLLGDISLFNVSSASRFDLDVVLRRTPPRHVRTLVLTMDDFVDCFFWTLRLAACCTSSSASRCLNFSSCSASAAFRVSSVNPAAARAFRRIRAACRFRRRAVLRR